MAWVFLTRRHAYKMKKPFRQQGMDFRSIERRRQACIDELRLNRRLAPDVYLAVVPLVVDDAGVLALAGEGDLPAAIPVDWLVKMRRLPRARMLDVMLAAGTARAEHLRAVGRRLGTFFAGARSLRVTGEQWRRTLLRQIDANGRALQAPPASIDRPRVEALTRSQKSFVRTRADLFDDRARHGRIIEAHGDLRPEHVCMLAEPVVIDCIEFSSRLRRRDPAEELAFLGLELERAGAPCLEPALVEGVLAFHPDRPPEALLRFHKCLHACTRAKLALWHLKEARYAAEPKWRERAEAYLALAAKYAPEPASDGCPR